MTITLQFAAALLALALTLGYLVGYEHADYRARRMRRDPDPDDAAPPPPSAL